MKKIFGKLLLFSLFLIIYQTHCISFGPFHFGGGGRPIIRRSRPHQPSQLQAQPIQIANQRQQSQWSRQVECSESGHGWSDNCRTALQTQISPSDWLEGDGSRPVTQQRSRSRSKGPQQSAASSNSHLQYLMAPWLDVGEEKQQESIKMVHHYDQPTIVHDYHQYIPADGGVASAAPLASYTAPLSSYTAPVSTQIKSYEVSSPHNAVWSDYPLDKQNPLAVTAFKSHDEAYQVYKSADGGAVQVAPPPSHHYHPISSITNSFEGAVAAAGPILKSASPSSSKDTYSIFVVEPPSSKSTKEVQQDSPAANIFKGYQKYLNSASPPDTPPPVTSVYELPQAPPHYSPLAAAQSYAQFSLPQQIPYLNVPHHQHHHQQLAYQSPTYVLNANLGYAHAHAYAHAAHPLPLLPTYSHHG